jgi:hypothetical protein
MRPTLSESLPFSLMPAGPRRTRRLSWCASHASPPGAMGWRTPRLRPHSRTWTWPSSHACPKTLPSWPSPRWLLVARVSALTPHVLASATATHRRRCGRGCRGLTPGAGPLRPAPHGHRMATLMRRLPPPLSLPIQPWLPWTCPHWRPCRGCSMHGLLAIACSPAISWPH